MMEPILQSHPSIQSSDSFPNQKVHLPSKAQTIFDQVKPNVEYNKNGQEHQWSFFKGIDWLGHKLTTPASLFLDNIARWKLLDFRPGAMDQGKTEKEEKANRSSARNWALLLAIPALIGGILGGGLRLLARLDKKDFVYHEAKTKTTDTPKVVKDISLLSMNVLFMPDFISRRNHQTAPLKRAEDIAKKIIEQDSDFVCLQEAFHTEAAEALDAKLHAAGYHVVRNFGDQAWGLGSGLMIASKYKLEDVQFFKHPGLLAGMDTYAKKGVVLAHANVNGKRVVIANTHLNGGGEILKPFNFFEWIKNGFKRTVLSEDPIASRAAQILALQMHVNKYIADLKMPVDAVIVAGDTNASPTFYEGRDKDGKLKPIIRSEWYLTDELQKRLEKLPIPAAKDLDDPMAWRQFVKKVDEIIAKRDIKYNSTRTQWIVNRAEQLASKTNIDKDEWKIFRRQLNKMRKRLKGNANLQGIQEQIENIYKIKEPPFPDDLKKLSTELKKVHQSNIEEADKFDNDNVKQIVDEEARKGIGGVFPKEYEHDVHDGEAGLAGTTINLEGEEAEVQPERVDFISPRLDIGDAYLGKIQVVPVVNDKGEYISDHHALKAQIILSNKNDPHYLPAAVFRKIVDDNTLFERTKNREIWYNKFLENYEKMSLRNQHEKRLAISIQQAIEAQKYKMATPQQMELLKKIS